MFDLETCVARARAGDLQNWVLDYLATGYWLLGQTWVFVTDFCSISDIGLGHCRSSFQSWNGAADLSQR